MEQVFPTKSNLISTKKSLDLAKQGYDLLDRKRNILVREMMLMIDDAKRIQSDIDSIYRKAYLALQRANVTLGMCGEFSLSAPLDNSLGLSFRSVMGVELPVVTLAETKPEIPYGINATNSMLDEAYLCFLEAKQMTAKLAQVQSSVYRLADAIEKTQKRTNALNNIIIPKFTRTISFISSALEEKEREDFARLKVIKVRK